MTYVLERRGVVAIHATLAAAAAALVTLEARWAALIDRPAWIWLVLEPVVALAALVAAWRYQHRLRPVPIAVLALAFHVGWVAAHQAAGFHGDQDPNHVYPTEGNQLLHGDYPQSEYPVGAVLLFAFEAALGGHSAQTPNRWLMVPFQLLCVLALLALRTTRARWLAAVVAIWPLDGWYWESRFDLVPAALMLVGLVLARRERWGWSGVAIAVGAAVKWTPAVVSVVLVVWLLASRRPREAVRHAAGFAVAWSVVNVPFLVWEPQRWWLAYRLQGSRGITNESIWYFPLRLLGKTGADTRMWAPAGAPHWADLAAVAVQVVLLLGLVGLVVRVRDRPDAVLALAALTPVVFLLANKVFSPQFVLVLVAGWAFAAALVLVGAVEQLVLGLLVMAASFANLFVYPYDPPWHVSTWRPFSAGMDVAAILATALLVRRATRPGGAGTMSA